MNKDLHDEGWRSKTLRARLPWSSQTLRPADVSDGLVSAMLARENILEDVDYHKIVPNRFIIEVDPENYARNYRSIEKRILKQWSDRLLEQLMTTNSRQGKREYYFGGPVLIEIRAAPEVAAGQVRILCRVQPDAGSGGPRMEPSAAAAACLMLVPGEQRWPLRPGIVTIGRDPNSHIHLTMPEVQEKRMVSSQHAYIRFESGQYSLFDGSPAGKPSVNGTFVDSQRVPPGGRLLKDGDVIILAAIDPARPQSGAPGTVTLRFIQDCRA